MSAVFQIDVGELSREVEEKLEEVKKRAEEAKKIVENLRWIKEKVEKIREDLRRKAGHLESTLEWSRRVFYDSEEADIEFALAFMSRALGKIAEGLNELSKAVEYMEMAVWFREDRELSIKHLAYSLCMKKIRTKCFEENRDRFKSNYDLEDFCISIETKYSSPCHEIARKIWEMVRS